jgi:uncharacterized protein YdeI (YjbR/CyaY-like superfamily)
MTPLPPNAAHPTTRAAWRDWLAAHHTQTARVWLVTWKKATGQPHLPYDEAVEEALCFGWIDSKSSKLDDARSMLWFSPRKPGTGWSRPNKERVIRLTAAGLMAPAGLDKVAAAQADGSWNALDAVEALVLPDDLVQALAAYP